MSSNTLSPLRVVYWTRWFNGLMFDGQDLGLNERECPIPKGYNISGEPWCTITPSLDDVADAAGVVFHAADYYPSTVPDRIENQPWILQTQESPLTAPFRAEEHRMEPFTYLASYHLKSSFLFSYYSPAIMDVANRPLPSNFMDTKTTKAPIVWIARNCQASSGRQHYVGELMKYIKVDSYSTCLNNQDFPDDKTRMELMSEYKFYLAIENANCDDYVTEKLFDTFLASTVPIVDGPKSYDGFIPNERSIIRMDAYPDPRDLAAYIDYLDKNDTAYLEHLSFRTQVLDVAPRDRLDPSFIGNWSDPALHNQRNSWCSVCRGMVPWWNARSNHGPPPTLDDNRLVVDDTCSPKGKWDYVLNGPPYIPEWEPSKPYTIPSANDTAITTSSSPEEDEYDLFGTVDDITTARLIWMIEILAGALFISIAFGVTFKRRRQQQLIKKSKQAKMDHEMCI